jgi:hypothetical protein
MAQFEQDMAIRDSAFVFSKPGQVSARSIWRDFNLETVIAQTTIVGDHLQTAI